MQQGQRDRRSPRRSRPAQPEPAPRPRAISLRAGLLVSLLLFAATAAIYAQAARFEFTTWDDPAYVTRNPYVQAGLTRQGLAWVLTHEHSGHWHPLTGLSHMLDCQLYGLNPAGHHLTSVLLHAVNALVLFAVLVLATEALWPSAFVAALFAVHPMHVESVAWVSARKDVLSTFFAFLALGAYTAYARRGGRRRYLLTAGLLALGLLAKPMLVTLPLVFLLWDYWPLGRLGSREDLRALIVEKLPLFALALASTVPTVLAARAGGALASNNQLPFHLRLANATVSYVRYLGKLVWPRDLAALYPHPTLAWGTPLETWQIAGAGAVLVAISTLVWITRRPYAVMGWLWYLGTLLPVIGLVQAGEQAMADRYAYIPAIGLYIAVAWGAAELTRAARLRPELARTALATVAVVILVTLGARAWSQAQYWHDSVALYRRSLEAGGEAPVIENNLGNELQVRGQLDEALQHLERAVALKPDYTDAHTNLAIVLQNLGRQHESIAHYEMVLAARPDFDIAHGNLGVALANEGRLDEAIEHYQRALSIRRTALVEANLARALYGKGRTDEAMAHMQEAQRLQAAHR
jgi:tetratricopeptide (TPR) repeat protein